MRRARLQGAQGLFALCPVTYGARHAKHAQGLLLRKAEWERLPDYD